MHCEGVASVMHCDYSVESGLEEKILIHILTLRMLSNSCLSLSSLLHVPVLQV